MAHVRPPNEIRSLPITAARHRITTVTMVALRTTQIITIFPQSDNFGT
jgi:hypothetical protein